MKKYTVYAFAEGPGEGNGAGVVLLDRPEELSEAEMQETAAAFGFSETAFVYDLTKEKKNRNGLPSFSILYFTPVCEVPLCGHATVAAFFLLYSLGIISNGTYDLQTKEQALSVTAADGFIWMDLGTPFVEETLNAEEGAALCRAYGLAPSDLNEDCPVRIVNAGIRDIHMIVKDHDTLMRAEQNVTESLAVTGKFGKAGVHMSCLAAHPAEPYTAYCSNFGPAFGIDEECATGTASAGLSVYLDSLGKYPADGAVFLQGEHMNRPSMIRSRIRLANGQKRVYIGGRGFVVCPGTEG